MNEVENNEIDALLRSLARHDRTSPAASTSAHLDVDELNAYAEGALSAPARARYTAHLADCDDCRRIVSQLSITAQGSIKKQTPEDLVSTSAWKQKLAALISPQVLGYALPVLALAVVAITLYAWRGQRASLIARNNQEESAKTTTEQLNDSQSVNSKSASAEQRSTRSQSSPSQQTKNGAGNEKQTSASSSSSESSAKKEESSKQKDSSKKQESAAAGEPSYAPEPAAPPSPKAAPSAAAKDQPAKTSGDYENKPRDAVAKQTESEDKRSSGGASAGSVSVARKSEAREKAKPGSFSTMSAGRADEATRSVAGRRFRRQSGVWIDFDYKSSISTISVARGSDQYRALIADEPEIGTIASQLSGEVIVVWKGHAYRIH
jgi:Putative zinc-finger